VIAPGERDWIGPASPVSVVAPPGSAFDRDISIGERVVIHEMAVSITRADCVAVARRRALAPARPPQVVVALREGRR